MPLTALVAYLGVLGGAGLIVINFVPVAVVAAGGPSGGATVVFLVIVLLLLIALPLLTARGIKSGHRWAPILVTILAAWSCLLLGSFRDPLSWLAAIVSLVSAVAVWMPSARGFAKSARAQRANMLQKKTP